MKKISLILMIALCFMMTACATVSENEEVSETIVSEEVSADIGGEEISEEMSEEAESMSGTWEEDGFFINEEELVEIAWNRPYWFGEKEKFQVEYENNQLKVRARNNEVTLYGSFIVPNKAFYIKDSEDSYLLIETDDYRDYDEQMWLFKLEGGNVIQCGEPTKGMIISVESADNIGCMAIVENPNPTTYDIVPFEYIPQIYRITYDDKMQSVCLYMSDPTVDLENNIIVEKLKYEDISYLERVYQYNGEDFRIVSEKLFIKDDAAGEYVLEVEFAQMNLYSDEDRAVNGTYEDVNGNKIILSMYSSPDFNFSEVGTFVVRSGDEYTYMELFKISDYQYCTLSGYYLHMEQFEGVWKLMMYDKNNTLCGEYTMTEHYRP